LIRVYILIIYFDPCFTRYFEIYLILDYCDS